ncbi:endonuclease/exonuclease/phosphatase family protein [Nocardioides insulae]|uniref:endonuclease/exonuclease/phosphatase family protein n=1 Tax=Nocardioides insulae TaxID=394734 RepID=UPI0003FCA11B|nr:endonuclease/exonuclease/phosphatase family protein [Nocardioides insulae]
MTSHARPRPHRAVRSLIALTALGLVLTGLGGLAAAPAEPGEHAPEELSLAAAAASTAGAASGTSFRIATFNVLGHSHTRPGGNRPGWASSTQRMRWTAQLIEQSRLDVVGFQEMQATQYKTFADLKSGSWGVWPGRSASPDLKVNSIAWRKSTWIPVQRTTYQAPYFGGRMKPRPLVQLQHRRTGQRIWVLNTHNPADTHGDAQQWRDRAERIQAALVNRLRTADPDIPVFLTGDMNDRDNFYCPMTYLTDLRSANGGYHHEVPGGTCTPTQPVRIDWVMGTDDVRFTGYQALRTPLVRRTSDHPLIFATAAVAGSASTPSTAIRRVVVVDVQGLPSRSFSPRRTPNLSALRRQGASTLNARTTVERTSALPNATSVLTGRRVRARAQGHGIDRDRDPGTTVHRRAGRYVSSVFDLVHNLGWGTSLFSGDPRARLYTRSWGRQYGGRDPYGRDNGRGKFTNAKVTDNDARAFRAARSNLISKGRALTVLQLGSPARVGAQRGYRSRAYVRALKQTDRRIGGIVRTVRSRPKLSRSTLLVVVGDSGGVGRGNQRPGLRGNYTVPMVVWGAGVPRGADLYALNPGYRNPGRARPTYRSPRQPIRVGVVANLVTDVLGMPSIPGSRFNARQDFRVFSATSRPTASRSGTSGSAPGAASVEP